MNIRSWLHKATHLTEDFEPFISLHPIRDIQQPTNMPGAFTKVGHGLAQVLQIKLETTEELDEEIRRGESVFSSQTADGYVEPEPHAIDWFREITPNGREMGQYAKSLFPFVNWIGRYNLQWLSGDLVAGM